MRLKRRDMAPALPGVRGTARPIRSGASDPAQATRALARRLHDGDVAVLDHLDLDRVSAEALVAAHPGAVVNVRPSVSGRHPARGAEVLVSAGIPVVDATGPGLLAELRDGNEIRVFEGGVYDGERLLGTGTVVSADSVKVLQDRARAGMNARLEAVGTDAAQFMAGHEAVLLDGQGMPAVDVSFTKRKVLVVGPGDRAATETQALRRWVKDTGPLVVAADEGLAAVVAAGLRPDLVVGSRPENPEQLGKRLARVPHLATEDLPEGLTAADAALVLALDGGAALVVVTGSPASFDEMLDLDRGAAAALLAVRLRGGERVVDAPAVLALQRPPIGLWPVATLLAGGLAALVVSLLAVPGGHELLTRLRDSWPW